MKKLLFALFFLCMHYCVCAQQDNSQTDVVALIENYLIEKGELTPEDLDNGMLIRVGNMLSRETALGTSELDGFIRKTDVGVFFFEVFTPGQRSYLLLKSGDDYEMMPLFDYKDENGTEVDFMGILKKVIDYFKRHPEIDYRLQSYYFGGISYAYIFNTFHYKSGKWYEWHHGSASADPSLPEKCKYGIGETM